MTKSKAIVPYKPNQKKNGKKKKGSRDLPVQRFASGFKMGKMPSLDEAGAAYARLLADPCTGRLVPGVGLGGGGGVITRFVEELTIFNSSGPPAETGGWLVWSPGAGSFVRSATPLNSETAISPGSTLVPTAGNAFLFANASSYRVISACMQIYWPGSELNRQGLVSVGYTTANQLVEVLPVANGGNGGQASIQAMRAVCFHSERMPASSLELLYKPTQGDLEFDNTSVRADGISASIGDKSAMVLAVSGIPTLTGVRVRFVSVVEWIPDGSVGQGLVATVLPAPPSRNTVSDVLRALEKAGHWFIKTAYNNRDIIAGIVGYGATTMV